MKIFSILSIAFLSFGFTSFQTDLLKNKKWRVTKQVTMTEDKTGKSTQERKKEFTLFDDLAFESDSRLILTSYGTSTSYSFSLKDSILSYWPAKDQGKAMQFRIVTSTKDSLILKRTEVWGNANDLTITMILHMVPKEK